MCVCCQGSRRSDEEALEEQVRKLGEELREVRELYESEQDKARGGEEELLQLHNQVPTPPTSVRVHKYAVYRVFTKHEVTAKDKRVHTKALMLIMWTAKCQTAPH